MSGGAEERPRVRLGVLFGGRSDEHEVSVSSARSLMHAVNPERLEIVPIGITKRGAWLLGQDPQLLTEGIVPAAGPDSVELVPDISHKALVPVHRDGLDHRTSVVDVVFPLLHGPYGEDGTVQGMLELAGVPYIGAGVASSAVGMDKALMKALFVQAGLPVTTYLVFQAHEWRADPVAVLNRIETQVSLPAFVKPCRLGSSVGISKAKTRDELWASIALAVAHDRKIIVEQAVRGREVECGLLGNHIPTVSVFGEVIAHHEFYDYEAKYTDGLADLIIPAKLTATEVSGLSEMAIRAFQAIDAAGMARVDFFIESDTRRLILNEINTIPGFAPTSMFPKLWEASGLSYGELVERLVELALERYAEEHQ